MRKKKKIAVRTVLPILIIFLISGIFIANAKIREKRQAQDALINAKKVKKNENMYSVPASVLKDLGNKNGNLSKNDLRKFPYPYKSMLAICSDIDDSTLEEFNTYHRFLNTKEQTSYGQGLGLDVGDSMWLYTADDFSDKVDKEGHGVDSSMTFYYKTDISKKHNSEEIIKYFKSGWIDSIHAFGDFSRRNENDVVFNRSFAKTAWDTLNASGCYPKVWINHGNRANRQNFGTQDTSQFMSYQQGDNPKSPYYHTDLTIKNGIKFIWNSANDAQFGYGFPLYPLKLKDGQKVWGFHRHTNNITNNKIDWNWTPKYIHKQLTKQNLDGIVSKNEYSIVGQHLGMSSEDLYTSENINSLKLLKQYQDDKRILVARTERLLNYAVTSEYVSFSMTMNSGKSYINIEGINDPVFGKHKASLDDVRGLTFYTVDPKNTIILLNKVAIDTSDITINPADETGVASVSVKWFEPDYTDYTK